MSLLWIDGFEGYGASGDATSFLAARGYVTNYTGFNIVAGRGSGYAVSTSSAYNSLVTPAITTNATMIAAVAFKPTIVLSDLGSPARILAMYDGATAGMGIYLNSMGQLAVYLGGSQIAITSGTLIALNVWAFLEFKVVCGPSGSYNLKVNGVSVLSASGINTQAGSDAFHDRVLLGGDPYSLPTYDDFYVLDGAGSVNNDFLTPSGNLKVVAIFPTGAGDSTQWTPSAGNNYADVNANPPNDGATYVEDATSGQKDLYDYGGVSGLGTIIGVQITTTAAVSGAGSFTLKTAAKTGGTESDDAGQSVSSTDYLDFRRVMETDAGGSDVWTEASVNAAQFGFVVG